HILSHFLFFVNAPATTDIYTLSLHDALPICPMGFEEKRVERGVEERHAPHGDRPDGVAVVRLIETDERGLSDVLPAPVPPVLERSEEHTSELQSRSDLVCRLLLEKKKKKNIK